MRDDADEGAKTADLSTVHAICPPGWTNIWRRWCGIDRSTRDSGKWKAWRDSRRRRGCEVVWVGGDWEGASVGREMVEFK